MSKKIDMKKIVVASAALMSVVPIGFLVSVVNEANNRNLECSELESLAHFEVRDADRNTNILASKYFDAAENGEIVNMSLEDYANKVGTIPNPDSMYGTPYNWAKYQKENQMVFDFHEKVAAHNAKYGCVHKIHSGENERE